MKRISFNAGELSPELLQRKNGQWVWEPFTFKTIPWRHSGYRDASVLILSQANGTYSVVIPDSLLDVERSMESGDVLRASYYTEQQEAFSYRSSLLSGVVKTELLSHASAYAPGDKLALRADTSLAYYVCIKDLDAGSFVNGLNAPENYPENYPENFLKAESTDGFGSVNGLTQRHYSRNEKIVLQSGYWEHYTCIRTFSDSADYMEGDVSPSDYPGHFIRGFPVGDALPCKDVLCRIRRGWNEHDLYLAIAACGNVSPGRLKQLKFLLLILPAPAWVIQPSGFCLSRFNRPAGKKAIFQPCKKGRQPFPGRGDHPVFSTNFLDRKNLFGQRKEQVCHSQNRGRSGPTASPRFQREASAPSGKGHSNRARVVSIQHQGIPPAKYARL